VCQKMDEWLGSFSSSDELFAKSHNPRTRVLTRSEDA
jgi:hypothetical protein